MDITPFYPTPPMYPTNTFDRNYTLTYNAASANQTLTITWLTTANSSGNVTLSGAALSLTPPTIATYAGTPQSAQVNTPFATALQAKVLDASGNPLPGATVTFTVQTGVSGASATFSTLPSATAVTNVLGIATAPALTANGQLGNYTVTATVPAAASPATFSLGNFLGGGSLSGSGNSLSTPVNLTTVGTADWVHWGDSALNPAALIRKSGVSPQINTLTVFDSKNTLKTYPDDMRPLSWSDGTPVAGNSSDTNGIDVYYPQNGFSFTVPADGTQRTLSVYVGGYQSAGTLTAHLSDLSFPDFVDTTTDTTGMSTLTYDRNYTLTFSAASPNQTLTVSWLSASGNGNVNLSGAALSGAPAAAVPTVWIDAPVAGASLSGTVGISGWAIENTSVVGPNAVSSVAVFVDGAQVGVATYGSSRADVCALWPGRLGCPNVGWTYNLNTTTLTAGSHTLKVVATDSAGVAGSSQVTFTANAPFAWIDAPVAGASLSGIAAISGWALENVSAVGPNAISSVAVLVDGAQMGVATYGTPRADVCAIWPGRLGCPNIGWTYNLNTATLAAGSHTLTIVATDSAGVTGSSQVTFTANAPFVWIDAPVAGASLSGVAAISGWALENISDVGPNAVSSVAVLVDGAQVGVATYGTPRGDVCAIWPGRLGCPNIGWTYNLNTAALTAGTHTLRIVATDSAGVTGSSQVTFTANAPFVWIDVPVAGATLSGTAAISGWALENVSDVGPNAVSSVAVLVDGAQVGVASYGSPRADVCSIWPGRLGCPNVGWTYNLNTAALATGSHTLTIVVADSAGITASSQVAFRK